MLNCNILKCWPKLMLKNLVKQNAANSIHSPKNITIFAETCNSNFPVSSPNGIFSIAVKSDNNLVQKCFIVTFEHLGSSIMCYLEKPFSIFENFDIVGFFQFSVTTFQRFLLFYVSWLFLVCVSGWLNF